MTLREKLNRLHNIGDVVLFRWMTGKHRIAKDFILLSMLRLDTLVCTKDYLIFSSSAPCLYMDKGRPRIIYKDRDVMTISDGKRCGMNIIPSMLQPGEHAVEARHCRSTEVIEDHCPKWLENKVLGLGTSPVYPVTKIVSPELFRISKNPRTLKPYFSGALIRDIGGEPTDTTEQLIKKFHSKLDMFGTFNNEGYVINNDYIVSGGCCVAQSRGISTSGSLVYMVTLNTFKAEIASKHWVISTSRETLP